jgi:transcriptional regulator with XRE-family HTH domain
MKLKSEFGKDFERKRKSMRFNSREELMDLLGVSATAIGNWEKNGVFPLPDKWESIQKVLGIDCTEYEDDVQTVSISASPRAIGISAKSGATVTASTGGASGRAIEVSEFELELLTMFRRYGNQALGERCLKQLKAIEAMTG